ncbi:VWA domain-containing protein [Microbispora cellulosiformans]|uniref:VWA domain-containing protein n=1 Tax=Microbispora cellulosiformans TaxID=2614688 RepID=A0A5J5K9Q9_9ACTN|nr:VWA domain-containing protein [Microbispora cellulosiformans]KAA9380143.1 VWA domain-containing protein [Microbispora cellulosiformans]
MRLTAKLKDLAATAGRWLGLAAATPAPAAAPGVRVVTCDRFDDMTWRDTWGQAAALRALAEDLNTEHDYTEDLVRDAWTAAFRAFPEVLPADQVHPSRHVNRQVVASLLDAPDFAELRRHTVGDAYASAMAVLAQGDALRTILERSKEAAEAARAAQDAAEQAAQAAADIADAMHAAEQAGDGEATTQDAADAVEAAVAAAQQADAAAQQAAQQAAKALDQAAPGVRAAARAAAQQASEQAGQDAALAAGWGLEPGELQRMSFDERAQLAQALRGHRLSRFAHLIGRFRQMAAGERAHRVNNAAGELVGVALGSDPSKLVPSELANLAVPALRADFAVRLAEGRLLTYETRGDAPAGKGAIIALVDTSTSMDHEEGGITREAWAKAAALSLLDQARSEGRDFVGILFSGPGSQRVFHFPKGRGPIADVLEFGETFLRGGTSFPQPLDTAADILAEPANGEAVRNGDIVLITDGETRVPAEWLEGWQQRKAALGFRVFGVAVQHTPGQVLADLCDNLRHVARLADLDTPRDLFRLI